MNNELVSLTSRTLAFIRDLIAMDPSPFFWLFENVAPNEVAALRKTTMWEKRASDCRDTRRSK